MTKNTVIEKNTINIILLVVGVLWLLISLWQAISTNDYLLFSRAGCIVVLFAVIVEYRLSPQYQQRLENGVIYMDGTVKHHKWSAVFKTVQICAHIAVIFGTIIWGYGDSLLECIFGA